MSLLGDRGKACDVWNPRAVSQLYSDSDGNRRAFRRAVRKHYSEPSYGLDPATIFLLVQMAIRLYIWAKNNGFLSSIPEDAVVTIPSAPMLMGEITESDVDESQDDEGDSIVS